MTLDVIKSSELSERSRSTKQLKRQAEYLEECLRREVVVRKDAEEKSLRESVEKEKLPLLKYDSTVKQGTSIKMVQQIIIIRELQLIEAGLLMYSIIYSMCILEWKQPLLVGSSWITLLSHKEVYFLQYN